MSAMLAPVPDQPAQPSLEDDIRTLVSLQDAAARIQAHIDQIKGRLRGELLPGSHDLAGVKVSIVTARRFDPRLAAEKLTAEQLASIVETSTAISGTLAKRVLPPVLYEQLTVAGQPQVRVS